MKHIYLLLSITFIVFSHTDAQTSSKDFAVVGTVENDLNLRQIEMRYQKLGNAYFILESNDNAIVQIGNALKQKVQVQELQLFLRTSTNKLIFNSSTIITSENISDYAAAFSVWKKYISGRVVIFSKTVFSTPEGLQLKNKMKKLTGLEIIAK